MSVVTEMEEDDGVPPLEDMSEVLVKLGFYDPKRDEKQMGASQPSTEQTKKPITNDRVNSGSSNGQKESTVHPVAPHDSPTLDSKKPAKKPAESAGTSSSDSTFGGLKKGFLFSSSKPASSKKESSLPSSTVRSEPGTRKTKKEPSSPHPAVHGEPATKERKKELSSASPPVNGEPGTSESKKTKKSSKSKKKNSVKTSKGSGDGVPYIRAQSSPVKDEKLVFPEVQEALKSSQPLLASKEWITEDLMKQIQSNPRLNKHLTDPNFLRVLEGFHSNPSEALRNYASNPEMAEFLKDFCTLMGNHFTGLADQEEDASKKAGTKKKEQSLLEERSTSTPEEQKMIQELIQDPEVRRALLDPSVKQLLQELRDNPVKGQRKLQNASPEVKRLISLLISRQILAIQR